MIFKLILGFLKVIFIPKLKLILLRVQSVQMVIICLLNFLISKLLYHLLNQNHQKLEGLRIFLLIFHFPDFQFRYLIIFILIFSGNNSHFNFLNFLIFHFLNSLIFQFINFQFHYVIPALFILKCLHLLILILILFLSYFYFPII